MSDEVAAPLPVIASPVVPAVFPLPAPPRPREMPKEIPDPDRFLMQAKQLVVDNYNKHRDVVHTPELSMDSVYIVWFSKTLGNWKAIISSPVARGLLWEVTYNGIKNEAYIDIYKKLNNVKVPLS